MAAHLLAQERTATKHFWYRLRARVVANFVPDNAVLIDVGAGAGSLGAIFELRRPDVTYRFDEPDVALSHHLVERFGSDRAFNGDAVPPPAAATLLDVIEHVQDDVALLRKVARYLPPGSNVIVTVPAFQFLWSRWDTTVGHVRRYRRAQVAAALKDAGLIVTDERYLFPELFPVAALRRLLRLDGGEDFPRVPHWMNSVLYWVGRGTQSLGRFAPFGSSILAVGRVPLGGRAGD